MRTKVTYDEIVVEYISEAVVRNNNFGGVDCRELGLFTAQQVSDSLM